MLGCHLSKHPVIIAKCTCTEGKWNVNTPYSLPTFGFLHPYHIKLAWTSHKTGEFAFIQSYYTFFLPNIQLSNHVQHHRSEQFWVKFIQSTKLTLSFWQEHIIALSFKIKQHIILCSSTSLNKQKQVCQTKHTYWWAFWQMVNSAYMVLCLYIQIVNKFISQQKGKCRAMILDERIQFVKYDCDAESAEPPYNPDFQIIWLL